MIPLHMKDIEAEIIDARVKKNVELSGVSIDEERKWSTETDTDE